MGKKTKKSPGQGFIPLRYPQTVMNVMQDMQRKHNEEILAETNNAVNLVTSAYTIVLKEFYGMPEEQLKDILAKVYEQLQLCADEIVTVDQLMDLCTSYGLEVTHTSDKLDEFGTLMLHKTKAFELLDKGVVEIEDIAKQGGMSSRLASAFRWQWNKEKFGKDYLGSEDMMGKRELAYAEFDKGNTNKKVIANLIDSTTCSVATFFNDWKKEVLAGLTTEQSAEYFAGEKELHELKAENAKPKKHYEAPKKEEPVKGEVHSEVVGEVHHVQKQAKEDPVISEEVNAENAVIEKPVKKGLKKIVRVVYVEGEFAEYRPADQGRVDVEFEGQVITLSKDEMLTLMSEFEAILEDEDIWKGEC